MNGIAPIFRRGFGGDDAVLRVGIPGPEAPVPKRGGWKGRPHDGRAVLWVRQLVETTTMTYAEISARTGIGRASICRWKQDGDWTRPRGAPVATDTAGSARASAKLKARTLHRRAQSIAERWLDELERDPTVDFAALNTALEMLRAARLARMPKRRQKRGSLPPARGTLPPDPLPRRTCPRCSGVIGSGWTSHAAIVPGPSGIGPCWNGSEHRARTTFRASPRQA